MGIEIHKCDLHKTKSFFIHLDDDFADGWQFDGDNLEVSHNYFFDQITDHIRDELAHFAHMGVEGEIILIEDGYWTKFVLKLGAVHQFDGEVVFADKSTAMHTLNSVGEIDHVVTR